MRSLHTDPRLLELESRVLHYARRFGRTLPEMRFFILDPMEFASLLHKGVYPVSPVNIWEGKEMVNTRNRIESGQESALYYEVVQTGRPSYAYLNETNDAMTQASVMAHVVGHCEFSELNVLHDSDEDRTERVIYLTRRTERARRQMGEHAYRAFYNACESAVTLIHPNSQFNLANSLESDDTHGHAAVYEREAEEPHLMDMLPFSSTVQNLLGQASSPDAAIRQDQRAKVRKETISRVGYRLRAPCQDILGFLRAHAPKSQSEQAIIDYMYSVHAHQDFVIRTQIMNEGWAMYWEKKIMMELFKERACTGIIEYCRIFSGVCYPRPWFQRNPYHLGFAMWNHIESEFRKGRLSPEFQASQSVSERAAWNRPPATEPMAFMEELVRSCTDYEFLRRYLSPELVFEFHLNRVDKRLAKRLGIKPDDVVQEDRRYVWVEPYTVKNEMLDFFVHFHRPRIYLIDADFKDGGLLLYHRDDGRALRKDYIRPTLKNLNLIWKGPVHLLASSSLHSWSASSYSDRSVNMPDFTTVCDRLMSGEKPFPNY